jgi:hypothetical protein
MGGMTFSQFYRLHPFVRAQHVFRAALRTGSIAW